ncbi:MAG: O-antigen ligase family protein [bacterium]|nr:O-antigen ligase family protein [bacterium]
MIDNDYLQKLKTTIIIMLLVGAAAIPHIPYLFGDTLVVVLIWCVLGIWLTQMIGRGIISTRLVGANRVFLLALIAALLGLARSPHLFESLQAFLKLTAVLIFGLIILNYEDQDKLFGTIIKTVIMTSVVLSFMAFYEYYFGLWGVPAYGRVQVLFPNPNHFAGFIAIAMTFALSVLLRPSPRNWFTWISWLSLAVGLAALLLTDSKGGVLSLFVGFSVVLFYSRRTLLYSFILGIIVIFTVIMITPLKTVVFNREIQDPFTYEKRELYVETIRYLKDYPILGTGLETFKYYYPQYKSMPELRSAPYVHNEVLNLWSDLGLLGVLTFIWLLILFYQQTHKLIRKEKRFYLTAFAGGVTGIVVHSLFEFNLHDPALALIFVGMTCTTLGMGQEREGKAMTLAIKRPILQLVLFWSAIILASLLLLLPVYAQNQAKKGEEALKNQNYVQAMLYYQEALKYNPISAEINTGAAQAYYAQGKILNDEVFLWAAKYYFEKAAQLEPLNPFQWRNLALYQARLGHWPEALAAYDRVIKLAPNVQKLRKEYDSLQKTIEKIHAK